MSEFFIPDHFIGGVGDHYRLTLMQAARIALQRNAELVAVSSTRIYTSEFTAYADYDFPSNEDHTMWSAQVLYRVRADNHQQAQEVVRIIEQQAITASYSEPPLAERVKVPDLCKTFYVRGHLFANAAFVEQMALAIGVTLVALEEPVFSYTAYERDSAPSARYGGCLFIVRATSHQQAREHIDTLCSLGSSTYIDLERIARARARLPYIEAYPDRWDEEDSTCNIRRDMHEMVGQMMLPYLRLQAAGKEEMAGAYGRIMNVLETYHTRPAAWRYLMEEVVENPYCTDGPYKATVAGFLRAHEEWFQTKLTRHQVIRLYREKEGENDENSPRNRPLDFS